ncbi:ROK family protein, partial [Kribbella solani]|uniref:ROK family protein n=1 Tax=Kribbella solani TaxID=236067 RepID=UPI0029A7AB81
MSVILAVDIGGTKIAAARVDTDGRLSADRRDGAGGGLGADGLHGGPGAGVVETPTPAREGAASVVEATVRLLESLRGAEDEAVAISTAGVVDTVNGTVLGATSSIAGWAGTPLGALVSAGVGLPAWVVGDGNAFGIGLALEYGVSDLVALVAGTGIGGSLIVGGEPVLGAHHAGGHLGHAVSLEAAGMVCPCGRIGHLEAVASGYGILAWYHARGGDPGVTTTRELLGRAGDDLAQAALSTGGSALGAAAGGLVNAFDPELVVVAGSVARAGDPWETALRAAYADTLLPAVAGTRLEVSTSGPETALRGAAHHVRNRTSSTARHIRKQSAGAARDVQRPVSIKHLRAQQTRHDIASPLLLGNKKRIKEDAILDARDT